MKTLKQHNLLSLVLTITLALLGAALPPWMSVPDDGPIPPVPPPDDLVAELDIEDDLDEDDDDDEYDDWDDYDERFDDEDDEWDDDLDD